MANFDPTTAVFVKDFSPDNLVVVGETGQGDPIVTFVKEFKGRQYFNLRTIYYNEGEWCPGKGITFPVTKASRVLEAALDYARML